MNLYNLVSHTTGLVQHHENWAIPLVLLLAFSESLILMALLIPATIMLVAIGTLIGHGDLNFWPLWAAAAVGAILGDWLSYWLGYHYSQTVIHHWPFSKYPDLVPSSVDFFQRWGMSSVFLGRFFGPLRASVPLAAGIYRMPAYLFQLANVSSGCLWSFLVLAPGAFGIPWLKQWVPKLL